MDTENRQDLLAKVEVERRDFLKKIAVAAAFAAPTIATFSLDGMRKKAFAQAAYDQPTVLSLAPGNDGQAVVTFSQPMNTAGADPRSRSIFLSPCQTIDLQPSGIATWMNLTSCEWDGTDTQLITFAASDCTRGTMTVTYNIGDCGTKFRGANGLELVPYSGSVQVRGTCSDGWGSIPL